MAERCGKRHCAIPGTRATFRPDDDPEASVESQRVRDLSGRDCSFDVEDEVGLASGATGVLELELREEKSTIRGAKCARNEGATLAFSFPLRRDLARFQGIAKTTGCYRGDPYQRKRDLARMDVQLLSGAARQSSGLRAHLLIACLTLAGIIGALLPAMRQLHITLGLQASVALLPGWIAVVCAMLTVQKGCFQNRANAFVTILQQRLNEGSFPSGYRGWEDARANLCRCSYPVACVETKSCVDFAWEKARSLSWKARLRAQPIVFSILALATYGFIYAASLSLAFVLLLDDSHAGLGRAAAVGFVSALLSIPVVALALRGAYHVLCGKYCTITWHLVWDRLLTKCCRYCPDYMATRQEGGAT